MSSSFDTFKRVLFGSPEETYQRSTLRPEQEEILKRLIQASQQRGSGGAFGDVADYYRDILSGDSDTFDRLSAPEMRRFREQIVPDIAEQFAGMGSGGLSSSGFRNAAVSAGADLSERLGAIRARLREGAAQGLQNIGQLGLNQYQENIQRPETFGLLGSLAEGAGKGLGSYAAGGMMGNVFSIPGSATQKAPPQNLPVQKRASAIPNFDSFERMSLGMR